MTGNRSRKIISNIIIILIYFFSPITTSLFVSIPMYISDKEIIALPIMALLAMIVAGLPALITGILTVVFKKIYPQYWVVISTIVGFISSYIWAEIISFGIGEDGLGISYGICGAITALYVSLFIMLLDKKIFKK